MHQIALQHGSAAGTEQDQRAGHECFFQKVCRHTILQ